MKRTKTLIYTFTTIVSSSLWAGQASAASFSANAPASTKSSEVLARQEKTYVDISNIQCTESNFNSGVDEIKQGDTVTGSATFTFYGGDAD